VQTTPQWDEERDVIVIGSGAGGMAAAFVAANEGLDALVIEKEPVYGGSTAVSGGAIWIPNNSQMPALGIDDSTEAALEYLEHTAGNRSSREMKLAYLDNAPRMAAYFERHSDLKLVARDHSPDYPPDLPGARLGGRTMDPAEFDGRLLGPEFERLRAPLPQFTILGGMMVGRTDIPHLLRFTKSLTSFGYVLRLVLRYAADRLRYSRGTRLVLGNALAARLRFSLMRKNVPVWLSTPAEELVTENGRVVGVHVRKNGRRLALKARRGVVLACGGFPANADMRRNLLPLESEVVYSMPPSGNSGDGIRLGEAVGGSLGAQNAHNAFWTPVSIMRLPDGSVRRFPHLITDRAKPGLIAVNGAARRFVNEACSYHDFVVAMLEAHKTVPSIPAYLICDAEFLRRYGFGMIRPTRRPAKIYFETGYLVSGPDIATLGRQLGLDPDALVATVERYNALARSGSDTDFGKGSTAYNRYLGDPDNKPNPCLRPLETPPFYAVKVYPGDIGTSCGLLTDACARVLGKDGAPIPGLYAVGNDMNSIMGGTYPGAGITLGPALTFGYLAGLHLAGKIGAAA